MINTFYNVFNISLTVLKKFALNNPNKNTIHALIISKLQIISLQKELTVISHL